MYIVILIKRFQLEKELSNTQEENPNVTFPGRDYRTGEKTLISESRKGTYHRNKRERQGKMQMDFQILWEKIGFPLKLGPLSCLR